MIIDSSTVKECRWSSRYWFTSSTSFANPAVTIGRIFSDTFAGIAPTSAPLFIAAQILGAATALGLVRFLFPDATAAASHATCQFACSLLASRSETGAGRSTNACVMMSVSW